MNLETLRKVGTKTPAQRLIDRGAKQDDPVVGGITRAEEDLFATAAGSSIISGIEPVVDRAEGRYVEALEQMPNDLKHAIIPSGSKAEAERIRKFAQERGRSPVRLT